MKKLLSGLLLFSLLGSAPLSTVVHGQEQSLDLHVTINAPQAEELEKVIQEEAEKKRDKNDYTEDSWKNYEAALNVAKDVLKNAPYDEEKVNAALAALQEAIKNLVPRQNAGGTTATAKTTPSKNATGTTKKNYPASGMVTGMGISALGLLVTGSAIIGWKKKK